MIEMKDGNRIITHTSKVSPETKTELLRLSKECNISSGDILTNYVENKSNINAHELLLKLNMLEDHLLLIERMEKEQNKVLNFLKEEHKYILGEIKQLEKLKPVDNIVGCDNEENIKSSVEAFFNIRDQHTSAFGMVDVDFDALKVGKILCGRYDVNPDVFAKSIELVENGLSLDDFLSHDLFEMGVI